MISSFDLSRDAAMAHIQIDQEMRASNSGHLPTTGTDRVKEKTRERSRQLLRRSSNASVAGSVHTVGGHLGTGMDRKQSRDALSVNSGYGDPIDDTASLRSVAHPSYLHEHEESVSGAQSGAAVGDNNGKQRCL